MEHSNNMLRHDIDKMISATLHAVDPRSAVQRHLRRQDATLRLDGKLYDMTAFDSVILIAVGKAAVPMATAARDIVSDRLTRGIVVTKYGHADAAAGLLNDPRLTVIESAHPVPDANSMRAGQLVSETLTGLNARTLVIACISGGASALMISPYPGIQLRTMQAINDALLKCGADITEMNIARSRLERLKSGGLVQLAAPATVIGLILSDVIGDPLNVIASGLTNHPAAHNVLVANNTQACEAAAEQARALGYAARIVTTELRGEAAERGREIASAILREQPGTCLIYGGEPTVTIHGPGKGGRNQELALAAALAFGQHPESPACLVALGTDGTDGPTDAAGALTFPDTLTRAAALKLDASACLDANDSYHFFAPLGNLIMTGPTGTNVADVVIALRL